MTTPRARRQTGPKQSDATVPIARAAFRMRNCNNSELKLAMAEYQSKRIALQQAIATSAVSCWEALRIGVDPGNRVIDGIHKSERCSTTAFRVPIERLVEIKPRTTQ